MRKLIPILALSVAPAFVACKGPAPMSPQQTQSVAALDAEKDNQLQLAAAAAAEGRTEDAATHRAAAVELDAQAAALEAQGASDWAGGLLGAVGGALPWPFKGAPELLLPLVPLLFKRPRKHFGKALKAANPWNMEVPPGEAVASILKAYGLLHSSEASEAVAEDAPSEVS